MRYMHLSVFEDQEPRVYFQISTEAFEKSLSLFNLGFKFNLKKY